MSCQVRVVLVRALEEDFVPDLRGPVVGVQRVSDGYVRLFGGRASLMMAPLG